MHISNGVEFPLLKAVAFFVVAPGIDGDEGVLARHALNLTLGFLALLQWQIVDRIDRDHQIEGIVVVRQILGIADIDKRLHVLNGIFKGLPGDIDAADIHLWHQYLEIVHHESLGAADVENRRIGGEIIMIAEAAHGIGPESRVVIVAAIAGQGDRRRSSPCQSHAPLRPQRCSSPWLVRRTDVSSSDNDPSN